MIRSPANAMTWRIALCMAISTASLRAGSISYAVDVTTPLVPADSMVPVAVTGSRMAGIRVTVNFVGGGSSAASWVSSGDTSGQASGAIGNGTWTLAESGDTGAVTNVSNPDGTAINPWTLTNSATNVAIASVSIDGNPASVVFDRDHFTNGQVGTPNSAGGIDYVFASESGANSPFGVTVTYSRPVQFLTGPMAGNACQGAYYSGLTVLFGCRDLWGGLSFSFTSGGPFQATAAGNAVWRFFQDTDLIVSSMKIKSITRSGNGVLLNCHGVPGDGNRVEASNDLSPNSFSTFDSLTADGNGDFQSTDNNPNHLVRRFYRVAYP